MSKRNLKTVKAMARDYPDMITSEASLRWQIFNGAKNGLEDAGAIVRWNGQVLLDEDIYFEVVCRNAQPKSAH